VLRTPPSVGSADGFDQLNLAANPAWRQRLNPSESGFPGDLLHLMTHVAGLVRVAEDVTLYRAVTFAATHVEETGRLAEMSRSRVIPMWTRFASFARALEVEYVADVDRSVASTWILAPARGGTEPSVATLHLRRSALRILFSILRLAGLADTDPTIDIVLPRRSGSRARPLADDEVQLLEWEAAYLDSVVPRSVTLALAESGLTTTEIVLVRRADLDLDSGTVRCVGNERRARRTVPLTEWAVRRLAAVDSSPEDWVFRAGASLDSRRTSAIADLRLLLRRSLLHLEVDVSVKSIAAWAGRRRLDETGRIEAAAQFLGLASLDHTAEVVGFDWQEPGDD
jgi:integrase/recombinase XerC